MSLSPYVFDATRENFDSLILGNSMRGLVLVNFWSPKAGPCMLLTPRLIQRKHRRQHRQVSQLPHRPQHLRPLPSSR